KGIKELSRLGPDALIEVLTALDDASPRAANWLRAAVDTIADNALAAGKTLPAVELEAFVKDTRHAGRARRLAYEWLLRLDPKASAQLVPGWLDDPAAELRRDAVALQIKHGQDLVKKDDKQSAAAFYKSLFPNARDRDQVNLIAESLKKLDVDVDLNAHYGFL